MVIRGYIYHKRAEKYCDCQDYFEVDPQNCRIAISDGMTQSIFPQWWAKILVQAFLKTGRIPDQDITTYQKLWQDKVKTEIEKQEAEGKNPWLLRDIFSERSGAGATLCGFEWNNRSWKCQCLGDSCLIKINNNYSIEIITSQNGQFDNHPDYLDSFNIGRGKPTTKEGDFNLQAILIVTDPVSDLFQQHQSDTQFIKERLSDIENLTDHKSYTNMVERWRDDFNMHNDDTTIIIINHFKNSSLEIRHQDNILELGDIETKAQVTQNTNHRNEQEIAKTQSAEYTHTNDISLSEIEN